MNSVKSLAVELSADYKQFCENLLALAEWLDSQDVQHTFVEFIKTTFAEIYKGKLVSHPEFYPLTVEATEFKTGYYYDKITNQERVLAVLMLRSAILAGDSFV